MGNLLKSIDYLLDLITPDVLSDRFTKEKLYHKLNILKLLQPPESKLIDAIAYIQNAYFSEFSAPLLSPNITNTDSIDLTKYYTQKEITQINRLFGYQPTNTELSYSQLHQGYHQNMYVPKVKDWYYRLLWYHFKPKDTYQETCIHELHNSADELLYEKQQFS